MVMKKRKYSSYFLSLFNLMNTRILLINKLLSVLCKTVLYICENVLVAFIEYILFYTRSFYMKYRCFVNVF